MQIPIRRSLAFSFLQNYAIAVIGIASSMILARLLTPDQIGIYSLGAVVVAIAHLVRDFGVGPYLIQLRELDEVRIRAAMALQTAISVGLAALLLLVVRNVLAEFYGREELRLVIGVLALNFLLIPFGSIVMTWFRREFLYRASLVVAVSGAVTGFVMTVSLALLDFGHMSMVWGSVANTVATVVTANLMRPAWFPWIPSFKGVRSLLRFGGYASAAGVVQEIGHAAPDLVIGKMLSVPDVAIYGKAVSTVAMFSTLVMRAVWPISMPAFARQRHAGVDSTATYYRAVSYLTGLAWPFFAFIAVTAYPLVRVLFGDQWDASVPLVRVLALQGSIFTCYSLVASVLVAHGRVKEQFQLNAASVAIGVALLLSAVVYGLGAIAIAACITSGFTFVYASHMLNKVLNVELRKLFRSAAPSFVIALCVGVCAAATLGLLGQGWRAPGWSLLPAGAVSLVGWYAALRLLKHPLAEEIANARRRLSPAWLGGR